MVDCDEESTEASALEAHPAATFEPDGSNDGCGVNSTELTRVFTERK